MKLEELIGTEFTVLEVSSHRILLEQYTGGYPSNRLFLVEPEADSMENKYLAIYELKAVEMK